MNGAQRWNGWKEAADRCQGRYTEGEGTGVEDARGFEFGVRMGLLLTDEFRRMKGSEG